MMKARGEADGDHVPFNVEKRSGRGKMSLK